MNWLPTINFAKPESAVISAEFIAYKVATDDKLTKLLKRIEELEAISRKFNNLEPKLLKVEDRLLNLERKIQIPTEIRIDECVANLDSYEKRLDNSSAKLNRIEEKIETYKEDFKNITPLIEDNYKSLVNLTIEVQVLKEKIVTSKEEKDDDSEEDELIEEKVKDINISSIPYSNIPKHIKTKIHKFNDGNLRIFKYGDKDILLHGYTACMKIKNNILKPMKFKYSPNYSFGPGWVGPRELFPHLNNAINQYNLIAIVKIKVIMANVEDFGP